jgi:predicted unusual protein kinase regulating ubiquinone biosynthesis (AarF/ABC1/UbiB family)
VRVYQKLEFIPEDTDVKPIEVALKNALPDVLNSEISKLNFKNVVSNLDDIMYTYPFSLPPFYIAIILCLGVLEGLAIQVRYDLVVVSLLLSEVLKSYPTLCLGYRSIPDLSYYQRCIAVAC